MVIVQPEFLLIFMTEALGQLIVFLDTLGMTGRLGHGCDWFSNTTLVVVGAHNVCHLQSPQLLQDTTWNELSWLKIGVSAGGYLRSSWIIYLTFLSKYCKYYFYAGVYGPGNIEMSVLIILSV